MLPEDVCEADGLQPDVPAGLRCCAGYGDGVALSRLPLLPGFSSSPEMVLAQIRASSGILAQVPKRLMASMQVLFTVSLCRTYPGCICCLQGPTADDF